MPFFFTKFATVPGAGGTASTEDQRDTHIDIDIDVANDASAVNDALASFTADKDGQGPAHGHAKADQVKSDAPSAVVVDDSLNVQSLNGKQQALHLAAHDYQARQTANAKGDSSAEAIDGGGVVQGTNEKARNPAAVDGKDVQPVLNQGEMQGRANKELLKNSIEALPLAAQTHRTQQPKDTTSAQSLADTGHAVNEKARGPEVVAAMEGKEVRSVLNQGIQGQGETVKKSIESPVASSTATKAVPESSPPVATSSPNQAPKLALLGPFVAEFLASQGITSSQEFLSTKATLPFRDALVAYVADKKNGQQWADKTARTKISFWKQNVRQRIETLRDLPANLDPAFQVFDPKVREFFLSQKILSPKDLWGQSLRGLGRVWAEWCRENSSVVISDSTGRLHVTHWRDSVARQLKNDQVAGFTAVATAASKCRQGSDTARPVANSEEASMQSRGMAPSPTASAPLPVASVALDTSNQGGESGSLEALATGQNALLRPQATGLEAATRPDGRADACYDRARRRLCGMGVRSTSNQDVAHAGTSAVHVEPVADASGSVHDDGDAEQGGSRRKRPCTAATRFRPAHNTATVAAFNQDESGVAGMKVEAVPSCSDGDSSDGVYVSQSCEV